MNPIKFHHLKFLISKPHISLSFINQIHFQFDENLFSSFLVSAPFVAGPDANASRQRHAPLYGRLVAEEHLPAAHRDAVHQVSSFNSFAKGNEEHLFFFDKKSIIYAAPKCFP